MARESRARIEPKATGTGAELVLVGPFIALGKHVYDAWKGGQPAVPPADPLTFGVASSETLGAEHVLTIVCSNLGGHGVYLESVSVAEPSGIAATVRVVPAKHSINEPHIHPSDNRILPLPILVPSGSAAVLQVRLSRFADERMRKKPFGKAKVQYTVSGVARAGLEKSIEFAAR